MWPHEGETLPPLAQMALTQYTSISELWSAIWHPLWPNLAICAIFTTFSDAREKHDPRVRVYREKFNIDFFASNFFGSPYICGGAHISLGDFKTHRDGHNHRHRHRHRIPTHISNFDQNSENNFFKLKL